MTDRKQKQRQRHLDLWFQSAEVADVETMCKLLQNKQVTDAGVQDSDHCTALHLAAKRGKEACVAALLDLGADPNR